MYYYSILQTRKLRFREVEFCKVTKLLGVITDRSSPGNLWLIAAEVVVWSPRLAAAEIVGQSSVFIQHLVVVCLLSQSLNKLMILNIKSLGKTKEKKCNK